MGMDHLWKGVVVGGGDASGGASSADPRLRRVGWAVAVLNVSAGLHAEVASSWQLVVNSRRDGNQLSTNSRQETAVSGRTNGRS